MIGQWPFSPPRMHGRTGCSTADAFSEVLELSKVVHDLYQKLGLAKCISGSVSRYETSVGFEPILVWYFVDHFSWFVVRSTRMFVES